ncbi:MAG: hypothetical protein QM214_01795 [Bacillota bacterium]|jgi:vacuolar-type H+-ATPase subunit H|nr:hypothetical protein [Bacillota bacterium]HHU43212.1 hypothetical protein [Clostridiales bacterium]
MLKETVQTIIQAEEKAEKIINDALAEAKQMSLNATNEAERIKKDTVEKVRLDRQKVIETAMKEADERYEEIISLGIEKARKMIKETPTDKAVQIIKDKVLNKYGNR